MTACEPLDRVPVGEVTEYLTRQRGAMVALLTELAEIESPTDDPAAAGRLLDRLSGELHDCGMTVRRIAGRQTAGLLIARPAVRVRPQPYQLLVGHCDTVWPVGTRRRMPVEVVADRVRGPGVFDMKGGLVQMLFALRALAAAGCLPAAIPVVLVTADEETGSPDSHRYTARLAKRAARAFVFEPAYGVTGRLKTSRKGVGEFALVVRGRAAHAGLNPEAGASAVLELSHQIQRLFALNDPARGVSVNVGTIEGGLRSNVVAPEVRAAIDVRVPTALDAERLDAALRGLAPVTPGTTIQVTGGFHHPPLEPVPRNRALWHLAQQLGRRLGIDLEEASVGGASDGNTTSQYTATLDGLGAVGDGAHAAHEYVDASKMAERAALVALLLAAPLTPRGDVSHD